MKRPTGKKPTSPAVGSDEVSGISEAALRGAIEGEAQQRDQASRPTMRRAKVRVEQTEDEDETWRRAGGCGPA